MRVFIGFELNETAKKALFKVQQQLIPAAKKGRFTDKDNFHLTLQFIGEANPKEIGQLRTIVAETAAETMPFELSVEVLGAFQKKKGLILWAGPKTSDPLMQLYERLHTVMRKKSFIIEKQPYTPHITLGRNIRWKERAEISFNPSLERPIPVQLEYLTLFESVRVNGRLMYRPFVRYPLKSSMKSAERKEE
ncbi:RNA 2',3'-cyclic phosphodiesterase [Desemzia incerta]|uniref:RNA 2',3'-cyclic phosphodiesterase n=1 Tax=Desemzia incerta TaxID=82801 RepID=UPI0024C24D7B|nr:RNA 2',3'-cyclic phosphodiesterase [Desemzia incerta]WHZ31662.1 RNA 2',3'-cyclic phosphodiesterase [Desemzia incerta]